jgi:hypothetical protein
MSRRQAAPRGLQNCPASLWGVYVCVCIRVCVCVCFCMWHSGMQVAREHVGSAPVGLGQPMSAALDECPRNSQRHCSTWLVALLPDGISHPWHLGPSLTSAAQAMAAALDEFGRPETSGAVAASVPWAAGRRAGQV